MGENTCRQSKYGLGEFRAYKQRPEKITPLHIDQVYTHLLGGGLSPRSVQVAHPSLRA